VVGDKREFGLNMNGRERSIIKRGGQEVSERVLRFRGLSSGVKWGGFRTRGGEEIVRWGGRSKIRLENRSLLT